MLFSGPMVRAITEGRKTQTRRVVKPQPRGIWGSGVANPGNILGVRSDAFHVHANVDGEHKFLYCPYGQPGDRLWVREKFSVWRGGMTDCGEEWDLIEGRLTEMDVGRHVEYAATSESQCRWRPSIHMPRWASRLTLEITGVHVERLQEISEEDAKAEGFLPLGPNVAPEQSLGGEISDPHRRHGTHPYTIAFGVGWDGINYGRGSGWAANPWVWVVEFRRIP